MNKPSLYFIISKVAVLQTFFYLTSKFGPMGYGVHCFFIGLFIMLINFFFIRRLIDFIPYLKLILLFFFTGFIQDTLFIRFGIISSDNLFPPVWFPTLWMMFLAYYGDVFNKMLDFPILAMSLLGAVGGTFAYYRAFLNLNIVTVDYFYYLIAIVWAVFMPFSLKLFKRYMTIKSDRQDC